MTQDTTTTSGATIQRYKIGYHADEWSQRSRTPSGIPDASGSWVRYADHVTALAATAAVAGCTRSHPHENMDIACRAKAAIAEMWNKASRGAEATAQDMERFVSMLAAAPTTQPQAGAAPAQPAAQGFRDGVASLAASAWEPVAWLYESPMPDGSVFTGASAERLQVGVGTPPGTIEKPLYIAAPPAARTPADGVQEDAALWHWLAEYLVGTRTDLDDEIVASETVNELRKLVEAAIKQGEKQ